MGCSKRVIAGNYSSPLFHMTAGILFFRGRDDGTWAERSAEEWGLTTFGALDRRPMPPKWPQGVSLAHYVLDYQKRGRPRAVWREGLPFKASISLRGPGAPAAAGDSPLSRRHQAPNGQSRDSAFRRSEPQAAQTLEECRVPSHCRCFSGVPADMVRWVGAWSWHLLSAFYSPL